MSQKNSPTAKERHHALKRPRRAGMLQPLAQNLPATASRTQDRHTQGMITIILKPHNVAVHSAEGRRGAPLPRIGCNGLLCV
jgi:hypothetical protein